ncbi:hypothetical protein [uncultured Fibrobacter sp.]|uniref:hypothetical protein n=1 Tax=uncultured Fibrobacter sp. TaxID=261512 RepID=UPI002639C850|nr:hypothetical protein [uncultured Fibrobacter sp.]
MSKFIPITIIPQNNSKNSLGFSLCYFEEETYGDGACAVQTAKKIRDSLKDVGIRLRIPTTRGSFDPEEILRVSKIAKENGVGISVLVDYSQLGILRPMAHLITEVEVPVDFLVPEFVEKKNRDAFAQNISFEGLYRKIESLRQVNEKLSVKFRTVVSENNYTEILADSLQRFKNCQWKILRQDASGMQKASDFKFFSFLRNNVMDTTLSVQVKNSTKERSLVVSSNGSIKQTENVECMPLKGHAEVSMDDLCSWLEFSSEDKVQDCETTQLVFSMKKMFGLFTDADASDEMWINSILNG